MPHLTYHTGPWYDHRHVHSDATTLTITCVCTPVQSPRNGKPPLKRLRKAGAGGSGGDGGAAGANGEPPLSPEKAAREFKDTPCFLAGGQLYSYQLEGLNWWASYLLLSISCQVLWQLAGVTRPQAGGQLCFGSSRASTGGTLLSFPDPLPHMTLSGPRAADRDGRDKLILVLGTRCCHRASVLCIFCKSWGPIRKAQST